MALLTVTGFGEVPVAQASMREAVVGDVRPVFSGKAASNISVRARVWPVRTGDLTPADGASLKAALTATPPVSCSGDLLGGSVGCHVGPIGETWNQIGEVALTFELRESDP